MTETIKEKLLDAALSHVPFDGWSDATFRAAADTAEVDLAVARSACPRGATDLAVAFHKAGDDRMAERMKAADLSSMRYSEKVAAALRFRLEAVEDREVLRRGVTFFALPQHAAEGSALIWGTADRIWAALGDSSDDVNWYSKRAILSGVYGSAVLYYLGDTSEGHAATWAFIERRIAEVMRFEKLKSQVRDNPALKPLVGIADRVLGGIRAPRARRGDVPGYWPPQGGGR